MKNSDRRDFLKYLLATLAFPSLNSCCLFSRDCTNVVSQLDDSLRIDTHCHIFNAHDLPVYGFLRKVIFGIYEEEPTNSPGDLVAILLRDIAQVTAPNFEEERNYLKGSISKSTSNFDQVLENKLTEWRNSPEKEKKKLYHSIVKELKEHPDSQVKVDVEKLGEDKDVETFLDIPFFALRHIEWVKLLTQYRKDITNELLHSSPHIDLFIAAMVDMDYWVEKVPRPTSFIKNQLDIMELLMESFAGRVHVFVPFDPYREVMEKDALTTIAKAILEQGFMGVKLYPPMGFNPIGNDSYNDFPKMTGEKAKKFGAKLDEALIKLYRFCIKHHVPIMAHCRNSNGAYPKYGERAHPRHWKTLLEMKDFRSLKVNLGHFGDPSELIEKGECSWTWQIAELMQSKNVYGDLSYYENFIHNMGKEKDFTAKFFARLKQLDHAFSQFQNRAMYGSDWSMIAREKNNQEYFNNFTCHYLSYFSQEQTQKVLGKNAIRYLGLDDSVVVERLRTFYDRKNVPYPKWLPLGQQKD